MCIKSGSEHTPGQEKELKKPENGFVSLRENAVRLALQGVTTREEILRVINEED